MNHIDKKMIKELRGGVNIEQNMPLYLTQMLHLEYEYSIVDGTFNLYTLAEIFTDDIESADESFKEEVRTLKDIIAEGVLKKNTDRVLIEKLDALRDRITKKMNVLTALTDSLQLSEYCLSRVEPMMTDSIEEVDKAGLCDTLNAFILQEKDTVTMNTKLQMVTAELPMRLTKSKFFDVLSGALKIYSGTEKAHFDEFVERIRQTVLLDKPEGYETEFPEILKDSEELSAIDYKTLTKETYFEKAKILQSLTDRITKLCSDYLSMADTINRMYSILLSLPHANVVSDDIENGLTIIDASVKAIENETFSEETMEKLVSLEGSNERIIGELYDYESAFYDVKALSDKADSKDMEKLEALDVILKLNSNSSFADIKAKDEDMSEVSLEYIASVSERLKDELSKLFSECSKPMRRAVMAHIIEQLPVIFNTGKEVEDYIRSTIEGCTNDSELTALKHFVDEMVY
ncbi:MAG: hypothetical protein IKQ71_01615 [Lachnospiraceae bacterium]|nr:hypothetical protein [Lachnospiraceae bacterium]